MTPRTPILFSNTNLPAGTTTGTWMLLERRGDGSARSVNVTITGTATVNLYGRINALGTRGLIKTQTASEIFSLVVTPELQVEITGATLGASVKVTIDGSLKPVQ
jgi:hypothetical protein